MRGITTLKKDAVSGANSASFIKLLKTIMANDFSEVLIQEGADRVYPEGLLTHARGFNVYIRRSQTSRARADTNHIALIEILKGLGRYWFEVFELPKEVDPEK